MPKAISSGRRSAPAGQNTVVVAQASSPRELQQVAPSVEEIPDGVRGRVIIQGPFIGPLADLALSEQVWGQQFTPRGAQLIDVFGNGLNTAVVEFQVPSGGTAPAGMARAGFPIAAIGLLAAVSFALISLGWAVRQITVLFFGEEGGALSAGLGATLALVALGAGAILIAASGSRRGPRRT